MPNIDIDEAIKLYQSGMSLAKIADRFGCSVASVHSHIRGCVEMRPRGGVTLSPDASTESVVSMYQSGVSVKQIAYVLGHSRDWVNTRLHQAGIVPRGRSESMFLRMSQTSQEERRRLSDAAHIAAKNRRRPYEEKCKIALTRECNLCSISKAEILCREMLEARGFHCTAQKAIGPYNIDVAIDVPPIAVEIFGGGWHFHGHHAATHHKRFEFLLNCGYTPVIIVVDGRRYPLDIGAIEYIVALSEQICRGESVWCENHMIRGDGKRYTRPKT